jgi:hypothetical protein
MEKRDKPVTFMGIPVCFDSTVCAPGEMWLQGPDGTAVRVWPDEPLPEDALRILYDNLWDLYK